MQPLPANATPEVNLAWAVSQAQARGWQVESATPRFVTMVSGRHHETNHVLQLILTLATCGLWAIVWLAIALSNSSPSNARSSWTMRARSPTAGSRE